METGDPRRQVEEAGLWIARVRLVVVLFAAIGVGLKHGDFPSGYGAAAWITTGVFATGALALFFAAKRHLAVARPAALVFDTAVVVPYSTIFSFEYGSPVHWALIFVVLEAALVYGIAGVVVIDVALFPILVFLEWWRDDHFAGPGFSWDRVTLPFGVLALSGLIVGWLTNQLTREAALADARAGEAEALRDQLGRRADVLEAANRCARALASSLDVKEAFSAFIRELRGLVEFDRVAIVLIEGGRAEVMAVAGRGTDAVFPRGSARPVKGSVLEEVLEGKLVYRPDMEPTNYPEERDLLGLGLRSRVLAPLQVGPRTIGMLGVVRAEANAFAQEEVELVALLGRQ